MIAQSSRSIASLHDDFAAHVDTNLLERCNDALAGLRSTKDEAVRSQVKTTLPPDDRFAGIGADIATRAHLRTLVSAPRTLVLEVPGMYVRFRRQALRDGRHFQSDDAATLFLNRSLISSDEVDVLLLVMLRNARRIIQHSEGRRLQMTGQYDWLESIRGRHLTQVFVDEATDFSAVQLGCTIELPDPRLRSWFACGDLR